MAEKSPLTGPGAGKNQLTGDGAIAAIKENTGPKAKGDKHRTSHPKAGGTTQGPSGDIGHAGKWSP